ncbi:hypothetical protein [Candidatus Protochlamydia amoebophila]|uniref:Antitoxin n=1 Tax=Protochlamydia amoebophila (strain UWE25) TaxID=264201 RepID=A0A2P9HA49_PARUW|nr:hypothetical protein [Candidatus Protochlamydia amoebophila]SPJ31874.1 unnamed protein product [Candidatus Protochlamydia amoebophila UWE25]
MSAHKDVIRFTFDCPIDLHAIAKMKASALHQSMKDYLIGLLAKDALENPPKYLDSKSFKEQLKNILQDDAELMQKLSDR